MDDLTEERARQMEAGEELDRICAEWFDGHFQIGASSPRKFSQWWSGAGPLLEAIYGRVTPPEHGYEDRWTCELVHPICYEMYKRAGTWSITAYTPQLAIARACAVLVARGITRQEVEGE